MLWVAALMLPCLFYAIAYRIPKWPFFTTAETIIFVMGGIGMFVGFGSAGICFILDAKRTPTVTKS